jgi:NAD(P)-dependent dehydrogenase (short-subunit alcohol dehydrogenase family)
MIDLTGKKIMITGASSGIGRATAKLLCALGARCVLVDIDLAGLNETKNEIESISQNPFEHWLYKVDLSDIEAIKHAFVKGKAEYGKLNGLVHCAGIPSVIPLRALTEENYENVQAVNTRAGLFLAKNFSKNGNFDIDNGTCSIVFISSVYGLVGSAANVAYAISKTAIIGMTKSLAVELAPKKIRVNCIAPGFVKTKMADKIAISSDDEYLSRIEKMHLLGWGEAEDIANGIAFLLSDKAKWITGTVLTIDGGFTAQ